MESSITQAPSASDTTEIADTPVDRSKVFRLIVEGVATQGLPIPLSTNLHDTQSMVLRFDEDDTVAVDLWAAFLDLPVPERDKHIFDLDGDRPWKSYKSASFAVLPSVAGWTANVWCVVAASDAEITAARLVATDTTVAAVTA